MDGMKILAFDTGGTILDWHSGVSAAFAESGQRRGIAHDWHQLTNEYRRRALRYLPFQTMAAAPLAPMKDPLAGSAD